MKVISDWLSLSMCTLAFLWRNDFQKWCFGSVSSKSGVLEAEMAVMEACTINVNMEEEYLRLPKVVFWKQKCFCGSVLPIE